MADILILLKMVNGALDCPRLLSLLELRIPTFTRSGDIFFKRALPSLYSYHSCIPRLMREGFNNVVSLLSDRQNPGNQGDSSSFRDCSQGVRGSSE
ncbi:hypothetical protein J6590_096826 [Homalodisca vitripennis]|nr:hypothetical protein J6590_096826 [Homalodisca vitripennis]